jgi:hypothetical protein
VKHVLRNQTKVLLAKEGEVIIGSGDVAPVTVLSGSYFLLQNGAYDLFTSRTAPAWVIWNVLVSGGVKLIWAIRLQPKRASDRFPGTPYIPASFRRAERVLGSAPRFVPRHASLSMKRAATSPIACPSAAIAVRPRRVSSESRILEPPFLKL